MNGPEGFLPKKLNFTMQVVQVLWYRPVLKEFVKSKIYLPNIIKYKC